MVSPLFSLFLQSPGHATAADGRRGGDLRTVTRDARLIAADRGDARIARRSVQAAKVQAYLYGSVFYCIFIDL